MLILVRAMACTYEVMIISDGGIAISRGNLGGTPCAVKIACTV